LNYARAEELLKKNVKKLHAMAEALVKYETIDSGQIEDIMNGKEPQPPEDWNDSTDVKPDQDTPKPEPESTESTGSIGGPASEH
jgi:cell division protease FtsH